MRGAESRAVVPEALRRFDVDRFAGVLQLAPHGAGIPYQSLYRRFAKLEPQPAAMAND